MLFKFLSLVSILPDFIKAPSLWPILEPSQPPAFPCLCTRPECLQAALPIYTLHPGYCLLFLSILITKTMLLNSVVFLPPQKMSTVLLLTGKPSKVCWCIPYSGNVSYPCFSFFPYFMHSHSHINCTHLPCALEDQVFNSMICNGMTLPKVIISS